MHGVRNYLDALYYGCGRNALFLRLDFPKSFRQTYPSFEVRIRIDGDSNARLHALVGKGKISEVEFWRGTGPLMTPVAAGQGVQAGFSRVLELGVDYGTLETSPGKKVQLQISLWANDLPLQIMPQEGWLALELGDDFQVW